MEGGGINSVLPKASKRARVRIQLRKDASRGTDTPRNIIDIIVWK